MLETHPNDIGLIEVIRMRLFLNLGGIEFIFQIERYRQSSRERWDVEWCQVELSLQAGNWLNFQLGPTEAMLCTEVEELRDRIDDLLKSKLMEPMSIEFIEPDFEIHLYPETDCRTNPNVLYVRPGHELIDVNMDWVVQFWDDTGALTANRLLLSFDRKDLETLLCYLCFVTGVIDRDDALVQKLIAEDCLRY